MKKKILFLFAVFVFIHLSSVNIKTFGNDYGKSDYMTDQIKAQQLTKNISIVETIGPLAPVAVSPFFGLTCLSGTSILCNKGVLPENNFLMGNKALNNGLTFTAFLLLTILTSVPKLTTVSKAFAEVTDQLETYSSIIAYLIIFYLADFGQTPEQQQVAYYSAGIFTFTKQTILMAACVINIIVINTVKYFFELLVLISPIPTIDAIFEAANKAFAAVMAAIYAFNPWLAFVINLILFFFCLLIFKWCSRRVKYFKSILLEPLFYNMKKKIFNLSPKDPDRRFREKVSLLYSDIKLFMKVFPNRKIRKIRKKDMAYLTQSGKELALIKFRWFANPVIEKLEKENLKFEVNRGITTNSIVIKDSQGNKINALLFSKIYNDRLEDISTVLEAKIKTREQPENDYPPIKEGFTTT